MLSFHNSTRIPNPVTDGFKDDLIGDGSMKLFTIATPVTDGIIEDLTHPRYCSQNSCEGGGILVVRTNGCKSSSAMTKGCPNAELRQQLHKAYCCEKSEEKMMGTVNDEEKKLIFDEETQRLMKVTNRILERMRSFTARWDAWYE
jgi:hypothetical protein